LEDSWKTVLVGSSSQQYVNQRDVYYGRALAWRAASYISNESLDNIAAQQLNVSADKIGYARDMRCCLL